MIVVINNFLMMAIMKRVKQRSSDMKVSKAQLAANRKAILEAAAKLFRERGFERVSVAEVMGAAGLTHGGFYGHFASKDDLVAQAVGHVLEEVATSEPKGFRAHADAYLSLAHRDDYARSCLFSILGTDAIRSTEATRRAMTKSIADQIGKLSETAVGATPADKRRNAIAGWSAMVGAVMLSRIADDPQLADELLHETLLALVGSD
jgi:TetR/AcrR family transcriptional repressor of nem operon